MKYKLKTASITQNQFTALKERLAIEKQYNFMLPLLTCPLQQLHKHLNIFNQNKGDPRGYYSTNQTYISFVFHSLKARLNTLESIEEEKNFADELLKAWLYFTQDSKQFNQILLYLLSLLKDIKTIYQLLDEWVIQRYNFFQGEQDKQLIKEFLTNHLKQFQNREGQNQSQNYSTLKHEDIHLYKLKAIKIYSWIAQESLTQQIIKEHGPVEQSIYKNYQLFTEFIQIKCSQSRELVKKLTQFELLENAQTFQIKQPFPYKFIDDKLLVKVFQTSDEWYNFLTTQHQRENEILLRYNILDLTEQAMANLLPHALFSQDKKQAFQKRSELFVQTLRQIKHLTLKICADCKVSVLSFKEGKCSTKELSSQQKQRVLEIFMNIWCNVNKIIQSTPSKMSFSNHYNIYFSADILAPPQVANLLVKMLSYGQGSRVGLIQKVCFLERSLISLQSKYNQMINNKQYRQLIKNKLLQIAQTSEPHNIAPSILFYMKHSRILKEQANSEEELRLYNIKPFMQFIYQKDISQSDGLSFLKTIGPNLYKTGEYFKADEQPSFFDQLLIKQFPNLLSLFKQKFTLFFSNNHISQVSTDKRLVAELRLLLSSQVILQLSPQQLKQGSGNLLAIFQSNCGLFLSLSGKQQLKKIIQCLGINNNQKIVQICAEILCMLQKQTFLPPDFKEIHLWLKENSQPFEELIKKIQLLSIFLIVKQHANQSKKQQGQDQQADKQQKKQKVPEDESFYQIFSVILGLQRLKKQLSAKILSFYEQLSADELQQLHQKYTKVYKSDFACIYFTELQTTIEQLQRHFVFLTYSGHTSKTIEYLLKSKALLDTSLLFSNQQWQICQQLFFITRMLQIIKTNFGHFGQIYYLQHTAQIEQLISLYSKCNQQSQFQSTFCKIQNSSTAVFCPTNTDFVTLLIQCKKNKTSDNLFQLFLKFTAKRFLETLFDEIFNIDRYLQQVYFNQSKYQNGAFSYLLIRSYLNHILNKIHKLPESENLSFLLNYSYIINRMSRTLQDVKDRKQNNSQTIKKLEFRTVDQSIALLEGKRGDQVQEQTTHQIILKLYGVRKKENSDILIEVTQNLLKNVLDYKNTNSFLQQIYSRIIKEIENQLSNPDFQQLSLQFKWFNVFINCKNDISFSKFLSVQLIEKLLSYLKTITLKGEKSKQDLTAFVHLLQRLLPQSLPAQCSQEAINLMINVLEVMKAINQVQDRDLNSVFQSAVAKIIKTKHTTLYTYIRYFKQNQYIQSMIGDIVGQIMGHQASQLNEWSEILSFFYKYDLNKNEQLIKVKLSSFVYEFKQKKEKWERLGDMIKHKLPIKLQQDGEHTVWLVFNKSQLKTYPCQKLSENLCYQPIQIVKHLIEVLISLVAAKKEGLRQFQSIFIGLMKIIVNYPIMLWYIAFHRFGQKQKNQTFVEYLLELTLSLNNANGQVTSFILFLLLEHNAVIRVNDNIILVVEVIAYHFVCTLIKLQLTWPVLFLICQLTSYRYFAKMCLLKIQNISLKDKIQKELISCANNVQHVNKKLILLGILTFIYRQQPIESIKNVINSDIKNISQFCLTDESFITLGCPFAKNSSQNLKSDKFQIKQQDGQVYKRQIQSALSCILCSFSFNYQVSQPLVDVPVKCSEELLKLLGTADVKLKLLSRPPDSRSNLKQCFNNYMHYIRNLSPQTARSSFSFRNFIVFQKRKNYLHYFNTHTSYLNQYHSQYRVETSNFAARDYAGYLPAENHLQQGQQANRESLTQLEIHLILCNLLKVNKGAEQISQTNQEVNSNSLENFFKSQQVCLLLSKINENYKKMQEKELDLTKVPTKDPAQILQWLKIKELQSQFDLKEKIASFEQFEQYCLSNAFKLERLSSTRKNKVRQIEEFCLQNYVGRTTSSDSIDYIIDTIDQNYQLLSANKPNQTQAVVHQLRSTESTVRSLQTTQFSQQAFEAIDDQVLLQFISLFFVRIQGIKYENFVPFLENKKIRAKLINSLIIVLQQPKAEDSIFPNKIINFSESKVEEINEEALKKIKNNILDFLCSFYFYGFYQQQNFLLQEIDRVAIRGMIVKEEQSQQSKEQTQLRTYQPLRLIIKHALNSNICDRHKLRLFRGFKDMDNYEAVIQFLKKMEMPNSSSLQALLSLQIQQNLKQLCQSQKFRQLASQELPVTFLKEKPFLINFFLTLNRHSKQQLKQIHSQILQLFDTSFTYLYFLSEITKIYTDQQVAEADWLITSGQQYTKVIEVFSQADHKLLYQKPYLRIFKLNMFTKVLPIKLKKQILQSQISSILAQKKLIGVETTIYAQRKKGIFQSAFEELRYKPNHFWLLDIQARFINSEGKLQSGYGGGVGKQWYTLVTRGMVNLNYGLFTKTASNYYFFSRESWINPRHLQYFEFIGKLFALSIVKKQFYIAASFSTVIYKMILGMKVDIQDIRKEFDEGEVINNLEKLRSFTDNSMFWQNFVYEDKKLIATKKIESAEKLPDEQGSSGVYLLRETFQISKSKSQDEEIKMPKTAKVYKVGESIELMPGGAEVPVTLQNLQKYIELTKAKIYELIVGGVEKQASAFLEGFNKVLDAKHLSKFTLQELRQLAEGSDHISISELKMHVQLRNYNADDDQIVWFWQTMQELSGEQKSHFLQHWTGTSKIPADGVQSMELQIMKVRSQTQKRIFAQTCFNRINMPVFANKEELKEGVWAAINSIKLGLSILEDN